jgi:hypothetical protein
MSNHVLYWVDARIPWPSIGVHRGSLVIAPARRAQAPIQLKAVGWLFCSHSRVLIAVTPRAGASVLSGAY